MLDWLIQIPGPIFLLYFSIYAIVIILFAWIINKNDGTEKKPIPSFSKLDSIYVATLRGGWTQVLRTTIFSLYDKKMIDIQETKNWKGLLGTTIKIKSIKSSKKPSNPIEKEVYEYLMLPSDPKLLFTDKKLKEKIEKHIEPINQELIRNKLVKNSEEKNRTKTILILSTILIVLIGGIKLIFGIFRGKPVTYLIIFMVIAVGILFSLLSLTNPTTTLGENYLKKMKEHFEYVKDSIKKNKPIDGIDPAFGVALFGVTVLGTSTLYTPYSHAFAKGGIGGACGGGCGGGGGGGCGGGCGGCGG